MIKSLSFNANSGVSNVMPNKAGAIIIDGKAYPVKKVPVRNPLKQTIAPEYREVVVINGKIYPVEKSRNMLTCDGTKDVVVIGNKTYNVMNASNGGLLISPKINVVA